MGVGLFRWHRDVPDEQNVQVKPEVQVPVEVVEQPVVVEEPAPEPKVKRQYRKAKGK